MSAAISAIGINELSIFNLTGQVKIEVHDKDEISIETTNKDKVDIKKVKSTIEIRNKQEEKTQSKEENVEQYDSFLKGFLKNIFKKNNISNIQSNNIVYGDIVSSNIVIGNNVTIINGKVVSGNLMSNEIPEVDMRIFVPYNKIKYIDVAGQIAVDVNDISSSLGIDSSGRTRVEVKGTENLSLDVSGQSRIEANYVSNFKADVSGQSRVVVDGSVLNYVIADISGQSRISITCKSVEDLQADVSGQSKLKVNGKVKQSSINKSGLASVEIQ